MSWCCSLWVHITRSSLSVLDICICSIKFRKFSGIISPNILSLSPFWTPTMHMLVCLMVFPQVSWALFTFLQSFFHLFLRLSNSALLSSSSQILSSAWLNLLMKLSVAFFISLIVYFSSKMFLWFLLVELLIVLLHCFPNKFIVLSICVLLNLTALP